MDEESTTAGQELRRFVAPEFVFGVGARGLAGRAARNLGADRVLVVTDPGVIASGWTGQVLESLRSAGVQFEVFDGVTPNPRVGEVMAGADLCARARCNALVAVGGGSPMDCAKGIGIVQVTGEDILAFEGADTIRVPPPPLVCVPTTAGSASEVSQFTVLTDLARRTKLSIISKALVPDTALIDPEVLTTLTGEFTGITGMDALAHAMEAYVSNAHGPITDVHALAALAGFIPSLLGAVREPANIPLREKTMFASLQAGLAFSNAGLGLAHAMAHGLGGYCDYPHGACHAIFLAPVVAFNFPAAPERYRRVAEALGVDVAGMADPEVEAALVETIYGLCHSLGLTDTLSGIGISGECIAAMAECAFRDPSLVTNPRPASKRDIEVLYERTL